jgi:CHAD domain-containing protein
MERMCDQQALVRIADVEGIHDMRVASRRMRAVLTELGPYLEKKSRSQMQQRIRTITRSLGQPRELDVTIALLNEHGTDLQGAPRVALNHAIQRLRTQRQACADQCEEALNILSDPSFEAHVTMMTNGIRKDGPCYRKRAAARTVKRFETVCLAYRHWRKSKDDEALHNLRIAFKKLRYCCELYAPMYGKRMRSFIKELKNGQEHIGDWNDHRLAHRLVAATGKGASAEAALGLGAVGAMLEEITVQRLTAFKAFAKPFFAKENRRATKAMLSSTKRPCCT